MIGPHQAAGGAAYPDWALLNNTARLSELKNETTAECRTQEGQPVAVSFWLADPPAVSQFTVHCPGLHASDTQPPYVVCAEGAFVLFCVTLADRSVHHFVYSAAGENPSLHLLPNPKPNVASFRGEEEFGFLPCGGGEHYAVVFLDWEWPDGETRQYYACVFSSETNAWRRSKAAPLRLSDSDQAHFEDYAHPSYKQITVGESAVGWVDLMSGILVACNLFDERPAMKFIPFPAASACITYDDGDPYYAPEYFRDVVCSGDLIRFVEVDFDDPDHRTNGKGWRANTWNMKLDWDDWRRRCTVDVDDVSVDRSYSALLPELLDVVTGQMKLKKLDFLTPTLSVHNDNLLYMLAKVEERDATAWVVVVDMKRAVADAIVPVSTKPSYTITLYCSCALPRYYTVPDDDAVKTDDDSDDGDSMQGDEHWRRNWCDESLASWDFSDEDEEEDPIKEEEEEDPIKENYYPNWALLNKTARLSELRNETTAECRTQEGQPVAVSFWLADPPAVSQFTVHCPGLDASDTQPPYVVCAEGAFVLCCVTLVDRSIHHFVYSAAGKNPSLHLLPDPEPNVASSRGEEFGLLPCGGDEHYAVVFLHWEWSDGETRQYYACVFSSETNTWRRSKVAPLRLSDSDQALFDDYAHPSYKRITVGDSAVGWVDLMCGILVTCNLFDETPIMKFIPFPAASACITYEDGDPYYDPEYFHDVVCSGDLIKFVELDFDYPVHRTNGNGWRANTWNMKLDWDDWRRRCTVDVDDVLVDMSYSALLPVLLDEVTGQMKLKKLDFLTPTLSVHSDNLLYMLAKVDQRDDTAWVVVIDMKRAVADAIVPVSTKSSDAITLYCSCALPRYYPVPDDDAVETDDGSEDGDSMQGDDYWRRNWCDESLASWDFSDKDEQEDPIEEEELPDEKEDEEEGQAVKTLCHKTNVEADMGNRVDTEYRCYEIPQRGSNPDDNDLESEHQDNKKKMKRKTRSSRRKKKQAQVQDRETNLLYLVRFVSCILMVIIIRASIAAFPVY